MQETFKPSNIFATIEVAEDELNILSDNLNYGKEFKEKVETEKLTGFPEGFKVDVNARYLIDCLNGCSSEKIEITTNEKAGSPLTIKEVKSEDYIFQLSTLLLKP